MINLETIKTIQDMNLQFTQVTQDILIRHWHFTIKIILVCLLILKFIYFGN